MIDSSIYDYFDRFIDDNKDLIYEIHEQSLDKNTNCIDENTIKSLFRQCIVNDSESKYAYSVIVPASKSEGYVSYKINGNVKLNVCSMIGIITSLLSMGNSIDKMDCFGMIAAFFTMLAAMKGIRRKLTQCMGTVAYCLGLRNCYTEDKSLKRTELQNILTEEYGDLFAREDTDAQISKAIEDLMSIDAITQTKDNRLYLNERIVL